MKAEPCPCGLPLPAHPFNRKQHEQSLYHLKHAELKAAHDAILHGKAADLRRDVFITSQSALRNGNVHKPATPAQGVLVLVESCQTGSPPLKMRASKPVSYKRRTASKS